MRCVFVPIYDQISLKPHCKITFFIPGSVSYFWEAVRRAEWGGVGRAGQSGLVARMVPREY